MKENRATNLTVTQMGPQSNSFKFLQTSDFLKDLVQAVITRSNSFQNASGLPDHPFRYGERQLGTILGASLSDLSPLHLGEYYAERPSPRISSRQTDKPMLKEGRIDAWVMRNNIEFAIEFKKADVDIRNIDYVRIKTNWKQIAKQIRTLRGIRNIEKFVRISLYMLSIIGDKKRPSKKKVVESAEEIVFSLSELQKVRWYGLHHIEHSVPVSFDEENDRGMLHGLLFIGDFMLKVNNRNAN